MSDRNHDDQTTVVVVTGAAPLAADAVASLPLGAYIIAADGGLDHALAAGLRPDLLVGDLDSVSETARTWAREYAEIVEHPVDKAATDSELAVAVAVDRQPERLIVIAGAGDRIDHTIAAVGALGAPATETVPRVDGWWGEQRLVIVRPHRPAVVAIDLGATFSVLALHGAATGVTIDGARWPLTDADLDPVSGLGVSNEAARSPVTVSVATGVLTVVIQPVLSSTPHPPTPPARSPHA